jgi:hypothetical protein
VGLGVTDTPGVEGSTPAAGVCVGGGVPALNAGNSGKINRVLKKTTAAMATNTTTMAQDRTIRAVATSRSNVNKARFRSR